jgi:hypothetical protein
MSNQPIPPPWVIRPDHEDPKIMLTIWGSGKLIGTVNRAHGDENAALIVKAVNDRGELIAALREAQQYIASDADQLPPRHRPGWALLKRLNDVIDRANTP